MKIVFGKQKKRLPNKSFKNGHLYQHASQPHDSMLYLCSYGYLIKLPECKTLHNISWSEFKPEEFEDVTDRFELREVTEDYENRIW